MLKRSLVVIGAAAGAAKVLAACGDDDGASFTCTDVSGLDEAQRAARTALEYVDASPHADKNCLNCQLWQSGTNATQCGACQVIQGPIHPHGYCKSWAARQA
jgi:hypothetical protein